MPETDQPPAAEGPSPLPGNLPEDRPGDDLPQARVVKRDRISLVWLLPVLAVLVGGWLAMKTLSERGPTITIEFKTASGLQAGKTKVKFKDVDIGQVTQIDVSPDLASVIVTAELTGGTEKFLSEGTRFWVARPRVTASRVSGLETLLSGAYVAIDPAQDGKSRRHFQGLADPPVIATDEPGTRFRLRAPTLGSLNLGSPVYYRHIQVGQVINHELDNDGGAVTIDVFVASPHDRLVFANTRFWNASGVDFKLTADGVSVDTESLLSVLLGGVAFDNPDTLDTRGAPATQDQFFPLYPSREEAHERIYMDKERYLLIFDGSVRGLSIGAPVLLRGIEIGKVLDVQLKFDPDALDFFIPVLVEIEPERIGVAGGRARALADNPDILAQLVAAGLRAQLKTGSLLTGQLYVELEFHKDAPAATLTERDGYRVVPTLPTPLEAVATKVNRMLARFERFPIEEIGDDLRATVSGVREIVDSSALKNSLTELELALREIRAVSEQLDSKLAPELTATMAEARRALKNANSLIEPDAPLSVEAVRAMREVSAAARSIRTMADYLERHPEALLKGKGGGR
ncbi:MAG: MlaD family protein [Thiohalocapsa sp.]|nr:MlaD family protein [Thiohalocapsa sp.]MCF7990396.1 MlaD family protein [Thiohalocapsa sp.]